MLHYKGEPMNTHDIKTALDWRYATKQFDATRKIPDDQWKTLEESLLKAPSSYGLQPWRFLIVENPQVRSELKPHSWNQGQITDASHLVVFLYKEKLDVDHIKKHISRVAEVRKVEPSALAGYETMMIENLTKGPRSTTIEAWAQRQSYIAMGFLLETAALLQIDACPIEGLDPVQYDKILKLEGTGWKTVAAAALGYRHAEDKYQSSPKVRFKTEDVIQHIK